jgi:pectate lyase
MPRSRNGELHILNCYYNTVGVSNSNALGLGGGSNNLTCYVENTHFAYVGTVYKNYNSSDGGTVSLQFDGCLNGVANVGTVTKPSYSYTVLPVNDVATYIPDATCGAGATLQVTAAGVMSSCGGSLGLAENFTKSGIKLYPTVLDENLYIDFSNELSGLAEIKIYSISGQIVFNYSKQISSNDKLVLNISPLLKGFYLCNLKINNMSTTFKLLKK